jgi:hypothetical protein
MAQYEVDEIAILAEDHNIAGIACGLKDSSVIRVTQPEIANRMACDAEG